MNISKLSILAFSMLSASLLGCYNDNAEDLYPTNTGSGCDTANVTYSSVVKPIIDANCATGGCHLGTSPTGYDLSTHAGLAAVGNSGSLIAAIEHTGPNPMPQGAAKLDDCTILKIKKWVTEGAQNN